MIAFRIVGGGKPDWCDYREAVSGRRSEERGYWWGHHDKPPFEWSHFIPPFARVEEEVPVAASSTPARGSWMWATPLAMDFERGVDAGDGNLWVDAAACVAEPKVLSQMQNDVKQVLGRLKETAQRSLAAVLGNIGLADFPLSVDLRVGGSVETATVVPGSDVDALLVLNSGDGCSMTASGPLASDGVCYGGSVAADGGMVDEQRLAETTCIMIGRMLRVNLRKAWGIIPASGVTLTFSGSDKCKLTLKGAVEADVLVALQIMTGDYLTLGADGALQWSPSSAMAEEFNKRAAERAGLRGLVCALKVLYMAEVAAEDRGPSTILLVLADLVAADAERWLSMSFAATVAAVAAAARASLTGTDPKLEARNSGLNVAKWTTAEKLWKLVRFLDGLAELSPAALQERLRQAKAKIST